MCYNGGKDDKFNIKNAETTFEYMKSSLYKDKYKNKFTFETEEEMGHAVSMVEVTKIKGWLQEKCDENDKEDLQVKAESFRIKGN